MQQRDKIKAIDCHAARAGEAGAAAAAAAARTRRYSFKRNERRLIAFMAYIQQADKQAAHLALMRAYSYQ